MKKLYRFSLLMVVALACVPFLPLYIERTMLRSWRTDHVGDLIEWNWKICSLSEYWSDYRYLSRGQSPAFWLAVNIALAFVYATIIAVCVDRLYARWRRRRVPASQD